VQDAVERLLPGRQSQDSYGGDNHEQYANHQTVLALAAGAAGVCARY
jgi:hypothetical protein